MVKQIISINEITGDEILQIVETALDIKKSGTKFSGKLEDKTLLLLFQKTSTRTRLAFELGMKKLGGQTIIMDWEKSNFMISPLRYESRYIGRMVDCIMARLLKNEDIIEMADSVTIPVINGCCDMYHPSQVLADLLTIYEVKGRFNTSVVYTGVQNNVANSLFYACMKLGIKLTFVTPLKDSVPQDFSTLAEQSRFFHQTLDLEDAVRESEFIYTDTWINMEDFSLNRSDPELEEKVRTMLPYQVNKQLIEKKDIIIMHDMPVHPGLEIDDYAINCEKSLIFQQAENRLYTAQALLLFLLDAV